jgi:hypothetical protein
VLRSVGNAPVLKRKRFAVDDGQTVSFIICQIRRLLKLDVPSSSIGTPATGSASSSGAAAAAGDAPSPVDSSQQHQSSVVGAGLSIASTVASSTSVFVYVCQAFSPSLDTPLRSLYDCFGTDGVLVLHYSLVQAWG